MLLCDDGGECTENIDVINAALQLGRLDYISLLLTALGLLLALFAIFNFVYSREKVQISATEVAKTAADNWLEKEGPDVLASQIQTLNDIYLSEVKMDEADWYANMWDNYNDLINNDGEDNGQN